MAAEVSGGKGRWHPPAVETVVSGMKQGGEGDINVPSEVWNEAGRGQKASQWGEPLGVHSHIDTL